MARGVRVPKASPPEGAAATSGSSASTRVRSGSRVFRTRSTEQAVASGRGRLNIKSKKTRGIKQPTAQQAARPSAAAERQALLDAARAARTSSPPAGVVQVVIGLLREMMRARPHDVSDRHYLARDQEAYDRPTGVRLAEFHRVLLTRLADIDDADRYADLATRWLFATGHVDVTPNCAFFYAVTADDEEGVECDELERVYPDSLKPAQAWVWILSVPVYVPLTAPK